MKGPGFALIVVGLVLMVGALIYQPTVSTGGAYGISQETYNLGKLQYQSLFFQGGIAFFLAGVVMSAIAELLARLESAGVVNPVAVAQLSSGTPTAHTCEWCQQDVYMPHKPCSAVNEETLARVAPTMENRACQVEMAKRGFAPSA